MRPGKMLSARGVIVRHVVVRKVIVRNIVVRMVRVWLFLSLYLKGLGWSERWTRSQG